MANSSRASFTSRSKNSLHTKWLNNAMKSLGSSTKSVLKEMSPNIYDTVSTGAKTSTNIIQSLKTNSNNMNRVHDTLKSNKYVRFASSAYKNALADLKSGTFNNEARESDVLEKSLFGDDGFSFGDDDEMGGDVYNIATGASDAALSNISSQMTRNTEATIKANKANMDAYIAVSSASMFQSQQIGAEIIGHLSNISNSLSSMVEYQNQNMTKFIEASMAYYDKMGSKENQAYVPSDNKTSATSVYGNKNGGINIAQYKNYIKQQFKDTMGNSSAGMINDLLSDDMLQMAASNPLGFASKGLIKWMIPKVVSTSIQSAEATFSSFLPTMLSQMADWGDEYASGILGSAKQFIGKTFGVRVKRKNDIGARVNKEATPFDGETKHAITEIITKELREQTSYLKVIANKIDSKGAAGAVGNSEVFDYQSGKYVKQSDVRRNVLGSVKDSYTDTMKSGRFGKAMEKFIKAQDSDKQGSLNETMEKFMFFLAQSDKHVDPINDKSGAYAKALKRTGGNKNDKKAIDSYIKELAQRDPASFYDLSRSITASRQSANEKKKSIEQDPSYYNLYASGLNGVDNFDDLITSELGLDKMTKNKKAKYNKVSFAEQQKGSGLAGMASSAINGVSGTMVAMMKGDGKAAFKSFTDMAVGQISILAKGLNESLLKPIKETLFGKKNENGFTEGGMFTGVQNSFKDFIGSFRQHIDGKEWTDSKGNKHEADTNSMYGILRNMGTNVRNGIMVKLFGEQVIDDHGNITGERKKDGLLSKVTDSFGKGLQGWKEAFLGKDAEDPEKQKEQLSKRLKEGMDKYLPSASAGAAIGTGIGIVSGGSVLGMLVGGPFAGAALGAVGGFLAKNEKFQKWLFGDEDKDNGVISKGTQEFFKTNKNFLVGSAALGTVSGAITGGGVLGTLVGGPVAGALLGTATGLITKSKMFQEFLYGDEKTGQKGIISKVKEGLSKFSKSEDGTTTDMGKAVGMSGIGAAGGGLLGMLVGGPLVGAVTGLGLSILAQKDNFHEWMFGTKDENGNKTKEGILGQFRNMLSVQLIGPMKTGALNLIDDMKTTIKFDILDPIRFAAKPITEGLASFADKIKDRVTGMLNNVGDALKTNIIAPIGDLIISPMRKLFGGVTKLVYGVTKKIVTTPFKMLQKVTDYITSSIHLAIKDIKDTIKGGIKKWVLDPIKKLVGGTFKLITGAIKTVISTPFKFIGAAGGYIADKYLGVGKNRDGEEDYSGMDERAARRKQRKTELADNRKNARERKIRDKNRLAIAKATNYQLTEDTEENRAIAERSGAKINKRLGAEEGKANTSKVAEALKQESEKTNSWLEKIHDLINKFKGETQEQHEESQHTQEDVIDVIEESSDHDDVPFGPPRASMEDEMREAGGIGKYLKKKATGFSSKVKNAYRGSFVDRMIKKIPHYADGGEMGESGKALVGEEGPEIATFPKGSNVIPTNKPIGVYVVGAVPGVFSGRRVAHNDVAADILKDKKNDERARIADSQAKKEHLDTVIKRGMSVEELKEKASREKSEKMQAEIAKNTKEGVEATKEHTSIWSSIFSKKGLVTGALILLAPFLLKMAKNILPAIGNLITSIGDRFGWALGADANTDGKTMGESAIDNASDIAGAVGKTASGDIAGGLSQFVKGSDGNWDHQSGARAKLVTKAGAKVLAFGGKSAKTVAKRAVIAGKGAKVIGKGVVKAGKAVAGTKAGKAVAGAVKSTALAKGAKSLATDVAASKGGKLLKTVIEAIKSFVGGVVKGFNKGSAAKVGEKVLASQTDEVVEVVTKNFGKISAKIGSIVGATAALGATVVGLAAKESTWVVLGAINGASGAARLFQVDSDKVDGTMIAISTAIGAAAGTTIGSIIDVVNELVASVTQIDFISSIAGMIYTAVAGKEKGDKLNNGRQEFQAKYEKYQQEAIAKQYETQKAAGLIDESVTLEQFTAGAKDGTYKVKYDSFSDYNDDKHKTLGAHIAGGAKKVGSTIAKPFVGAKNALFGKKADIYTDGNGTSYTKQKDGTYAVTDKSGKSLGSVAQDAVDVSAMTKSGGTKGLVGNTASAIGKAGKATGAAIVKTTKSAVGLAKNLGGKAVNTAKGALSFGKDLGSDILGVVTGKKDKIDVKVDKNDPLGGVKKSVAGVADLVSSPIKMITGTFSKIGTSIKDLMSPLEKMKETNDDAKLLEKDMSISDYLKNPNAKEKGFGGTIKSVMFYINRIGGIIPFMMNKVTGKIGDGVKGVAGKIAGLFGGKDETTTTTTGGKGGGRGDSESGTVNNFAFYGQNDPRWKNKKYGNDGATMGDSGCGPAAMSMVATQLTGSKVTPTAMAGLAEMTGDRDQTGTNWNFINNASRTMGIQSSEQRNPSGSYISQQVAAGNPVILSGTSANNGPYTKAGHYIVATGRDSNGKIKVNDPRGKGYSKSYSPEELGKRTGAAWSFSGGRGARRLRGGRGEDTSTGTKVTASDVIQIALNEVGYQEKAVNEGLDKKNVGAGDKNYTKYGVLTKTNGQPWCCSFVVWCMYSAANNNLNTASNLLGGTTSAACQTVYQTLKSKQRIVADPIPGDLIFYSSKGDGHSNHIGIVVAVDGDTVSTVEGNTSNPSTEFERDGGCVARKSVKKNNKRIMAFGRPFYDGTSGFKGIDTSTGTVGGNSLGDVTADGVGGTMINSTGSVEGGSTSIFDSIGNFFSEFGTRALNGIFGGKYDSDYSGIFAGARTDSGNEVITNADGSTSEVPMQTDDTDFTTASGDSIPQKVWNFLKGKNLSNEAVAAVMGNMQQESGMKPTAANKNSSAFGLCQWLGGRRTNLQNYAASIGKTETDTDAQLNHLWSELNGSEKKSLKVLQESGTVDSLTTKFEQAFERSKDSASYPKRINYAKQYYNQFASTGGGGGRGTGTGASVNYGSSFSNAATTSRQSYSSAVKASNYTANNTSSLPALLSTIVNILSSIDGNTAGTTDALSALKSLQGSFSSSVNNVSAIDVKSGGTSPSSNAVILDKANGQKESRDQIMAQKIARGY